MSMIEKVARAIENSLLADGIDTHVVAHAAIEAMREPSIDMAFAASDRMLGKIHAGELSPSDWKNVWQSMIDAALKEETR